MGHPARAPPPPPSRHCPCGLLEQPGPLCPAPSFHNFNPAPALPGIAQPSCTHEHPSLPSPGMLWPWRGSLCPGGDTGTLQNVPAHNAWAMWGRPALLLPGPSPATDPGRASWRQRDRSLLARGGAWGQARTWIPSIFPHSKNNHKHFCIQQLRERLGTPPGKGEKRGKKAEFPIRDRASHRQTQPHVQPSTGSAGSTATLPSKARDGSEGAAGSTVLPAGWAGSCCR